MSKTEIIYVDDEEHLRLAAQQSFDLAGLKAEIFARPKDVLDRLATGFDGVVVSDIRMPEMDGTVLLQEILKAHPEIPAILLMGYGDVSTAVESIKAGAYDFLEKPCEPARLVACIKRALAMRHLQRENAALRQQVRSGNALEAQLNGRSQIMADLRRMIATVASTDADVLITGETGTGKERAARAIYRTSSRADRPFVHINCAALPETLIESELFGHEAGAFPGAMKARFGKLEHARGGILCLDEVDSLPLPLQAKLLDVLHNRVVTRLGSNDPIALDIRVIAISKKDLTAAVDRGEFRADLLYRLNVMTINLPSLAERREDIPGLFAILIKEAAEKFGLDATEPSADILNDLAARDWPGNVRELRNAAERYVLGFDAGTKSVAEDKGTLADRLMAYEKDLISAAIKAQNGSLKGVYESLGISRKTLYDKMQKYELSRGRIERDD